VPVIRSAMGRSLPMPNSKRQSHSLALERDHVAASGPRSSFGRDACFPAMGVVARAAMWWAYLWRKTAWAEWQAGREALRAEWRAGRRARPGMGRRAQVVERVIGFLETAIGRTCFGGEGGATTLSCVTGEMVAAICGACTTLGSSTGVKGGRIGRRVARRRICAIWMNAFFVVEPNASGKWCSFWLWRRLSISLAVWRK
jgi:hypothetical protein